MQKFIMLVLGTILLHTTSLVLQAQDLPDAAPPENAETPAAVAEPTEEELAIARARRAMLRELKARQRIDAALDINTKIDMFDTPLHEVIRDIATEHKLTIVLDTEALELAGIQPDTLISMKVQEISLRSALRILLHPLHLTFAVRHEVLMITALDCPEDKATIRTFPVAELLSRMDDPYELVTTLELVLPESGRIDPETQCKPRFREIAGHLVVRGSPRHHDLAEQFLESIMLGNSLADAAEGMKPVVRTIELSPGTRPRFEELPQEE